MSNIRTQHIFTSESVSEGHPDKVSDQISDAILDACLKQDPESRVAVETLCTTQLIVISGEITTRAVVDYEKIARSIACEIGYNDPKLGFDGNTCKVEVYIHTQSPDISQGVTAGEGLHKEQGAGDQGMMFGYACNETDALMPAPVYYAHRIVAELARMRKTMPEKYPFLRPDAKSQISMRYVNNKPVAIDTIVVSHQHDENVSKETLEDAIHTAVGNVIPAALLTDKTLYHINPTGRFVLGGPAGDTGLTGRKIIVDTYGGVSSHGGGAFSGKDPSKVDRSAAYMARYIAKNIVASGLADRCTIQCAYAIGVAKPVSIYVNTFDTGKLADDGLLEKIVSEVFDMTPAGIIRELKLKTPEGWSYNQTASYGHFGRSIFPWEQTSRTADLLKAAAKYL